MNIAKSLRTTILNNFCEWTTASAIPCFFLDTDLPLLANQYQLDHHFMLGTNIILEENQNDGRSKNSEVKEEESTDRDSKL